MRLHKNVGTIDRIVRIIGGVALAAAVLGGLVGNPLTYVAGLVAGILLVTAATGFCPLYALLRISTRPSEG
jgi:hypothetical protein